MENLTVRTNEQGEIQINFSEIPFISDGIRPSVQVWLSEEEARNLAISIQDELQNNDLVFQAQNNPDHERI
jgi:hypothetical protein